MYSLVYYSLIFIVSALFVLFHLFAGIIGRVQCDAAQFTPRFGCRIFSTHIRFARQSRCKLRHAIVERQLLVKERVQVKLVLAEELCNEKEKQLVTCE